MEARNTVSALVESLGSDSQTGLSEAEAELRLSKYGKNTIFEKKIGFHWGILGVLKEPMIWLLAIAAAVYFMLGETLDAAIMAIAIVPIAFTDFIIERQTDKALEKLERLGEPRATVIRGGMQMSIHPDYLVPGDVVVVREGDIMMADCAIISGSDLKADESSLTGESVPLEKEPQETYSEEFFSNRGTLFAGTRVLSGRAACIVVRTGASTSYGKIGKMLAKTITVKTRLQQDVEKIVEGLGVVAIVISAALAGLELASGHSWSAAIISGVSLAIAAIPEEFPMVFTLFLSLGMLALAANKALVKKLTAVETLGSVSVICTDKTGTLTTGTMEVGEIYDGIDYRGAEFLHTKGADPFLLRALMACEKEPFDYMERAIYDYAKTSGANEELGKWELVQEYNFDPQEKRMSHVWKKGGKLVISGKGAVEGIMNCCRLTEKEKTAVHEANERMAERGVRVLAFAHKELSRISGRKNDEKGMEFGGLIGFYDPLRGGVPEAVREARGAGIRVVMLTGDHRATAQFIADEIGIGGEVFDGRKLASLGEKEFLKILEAHSAFSRVLPEEKLRIVEGYQKLGMSVAVTGDGINDAPALKRADIGIAMGERGTEVAKEAAAFVLLDDNFTTIVAAIRNGRRIYDNLQKAFNYLIAFHIPIFMSALVVPALGLPMFLLPIHIVLLELVLHPVVSVAFERQPAEAGIMSRMPRERSKPMLEKGQMIRAVVSGALLFAVAFLAYYGFYSLGYGEDGARAFAFTSLLLGQVLLMVSELSSGRMNLGRLAGNAPALLIVAVVLLCYLAVMYVPFLAYVASVAPLSFAEWAAAFGLALIPFAASELLKRP